MTVKRKEANMNYTKNGSLLKTKKTTTLTPLSQRGAGEISTDERRENLEKSLSTYPEILSAKQVGEILHVTSRTITNYRNLGWLVSHDLSTHSFSYLKSEIIDFILSRRQEDAFDRKIPKFQIIKKEKKQEPEIPSLFG